MFARFIRRVARVLSDMQYAERRMTVLRTSADHYVMDPDHAPRDYAEFMFRTSGSLLREPSADLRSRGQLVR